MTTEKAQELVQRVMTDDEFRQRLEAAPDDQKRAVLDEAGFADVKLRHMSEVMPESHGGELSDDEFAAVAGGMGSETEVTLSAAGSAVSGVTLVTAAAAAAV